MLVRRPLPEDAAGWREARLACRARRRRGGRREHEALCALLEDAGAEVVVSEHDPGNPDAIYVYDPVLVGDEGAVLLRPGKEGRPERARTRSALALEAAGVPIAGRHEAAGRRSKVATRSGSTGRRCSSASATGRTRRASQALRAGLPGRRGRSRSTCRTGTAPVR